MTAAEERAMVEDKALPLWELRAPAGYVVIGFGDPGARRGTEVVPVRRLVCSTTEHGERGAVVTGRFRVPWWPAGREEHAAYCQMCARLAVFLGYFVPDFEGWR
ncbi:hypothetical protein HYQ03_gp66 [Arthrobacter phage Kuleana]|uniref:Uncharacterized protein n=1 Tax=Arthrobacter phage Kuleana TaxID=2653270 RepID=A0A5Q2WB64_9CAUD|nr:hypothetical protein HYQ03_gp66 [Arthrobacter phage Kuleana]QGH74553.1 hypothetical protein SEA_KULEANA_66 [Arthrobacter phage Kuleana]